MPPISWNFETGAGPDFILDDFLEKEWLKDLQANSRPAFKNATNQNVTVFGTITVLVRIGDSGVRVVFGVVRELAVPLLSETSYIDIFVKGIFSREGMIVCCNSKLVVICAITNTPEEHNDKAKDLTVIYEDALHLVLVARQKNNRPRWEGTAKVATDARRLAKVGLLLEWDSTQA